MNSLLSMTAQPAACADPLSPIVRLTTAIAELAARLGAVVAMTQSTGGSQPASTGKPKGAKDSSDPKPPNNGGPQPTGGPGHIEPPTNSKRSVTRALAPRRRSGSIKA